MDGNILPFVWVGLMCCVGPLLVFGLGVAIGRHGMPFSVTMRRMERRQGQGRYG